MFTLMKWNEKYGDAARFIVKDNKTNKFTLFAPDHEHDVHWVDQDMTKLPQYKNWDNFGHETVAFLENIIM